MDLGNALKRLRNSRGLNQRELAKLCGISPATVCNLEKKTDITTQDSAIRALCDFLEIKPAHLLIASLTKDDVEEGKWEMVKLMQDYILSPSK